MRLPSAFSPLRVARFRGLWLAGLVSFLGTWVHNVAARWTAASLAASPLAVSAVDTLQLLPMVALSVAAGALADRRDRRELLVATHLGLAAVTATMAVFAATGMLSLPVLLGLTTFLGVLGALTGPAWQATVPRQVPDEEVPRAVALMSTGFNLARAVGPALGAWLLVGFGPAAAFATNTASYLLIAALLWRLPPQPPLGRGRDVPSPLSVPALRHLYVVGAAFGLCAMPSLSLLPVVARDALAGGADAYGGLLGAFGAGAVVSGLLVADGARRFGERVFLAGACVVGAVGFLGMASAATVLPAMFASFVSGSAWIGAVATINAGVQVHAPASVRARALATYLGFAVGGQALGSLSGGALAETFGLANALRLCAGALLLLAVAVQMRYRAGGTSEEGT